MSKVYRLIWLAMTKQLGLMNHRMNFSPEITLVRIVKIVSKPRRQEAKNEDLRVFEVWRIQVIRLVGSSTDVHSINHSFNQLKNLNFLSKLQNPNEIKLPKIAPPIISPGK